MLRVLLLGLGALAVGTDAYLMAGLLPSIARDLHESAATAGQLVTVFMLCYAVLAPLVGAALWRWSIRQVLIGALTLFTMANAATALAPSLAVLLVTRGLAGLAAGVFIPVAAAAASAMVTPERRGRALTLVLGGLSSGTVVGVPSGLLLAEQGGWRAGLWLVTAVGGLALAGVVSLLPNVCGATMPGLAERRAQLTDRRVGLAIVATLMQTLASLGLYTYLMGVLDAVSLHTPQLALWLWGIGGVLGSFGIGPLLDRLGRANVMAGALLAGLALTLVLLPWAHGKAALPLLAVWGAVGWAFVVPQQHRLLALRPEGGAAVLALNSSATYLGGAVGAALGGAALSAGTAPRLLPTCAAAVAVLGVVAHMASVRRGKKTPAATHATSEERPGGRNEVRR